MRVLIVHNAYQQSGGEDTVVRMESEMLATHDSLAGIYIVDNHTISSLGGKLRAALGVIFSPASYFRIRKLLREIRPDVVHVHNFFPLLSPSVFYACHSENVPVVLTLHNYRIICPTALLMHDGKITERSLEEGPWWALKYKVYRGSWLGTFLLCLMIDVHRRIGTWRKRVNRFIVLSHFAVGKFAAAGLPVEKMVVKPNFVNISSAQKTKRCGLLFVGRLSPEKGVDILLRAAKNKKFLRGDIIIAGHGPLVDKIQGGGITYLGSLPSHFIWERMQNASALLLPSIWYEGFPMVIVEAYANGLPVIASRIGALEELIEDGVTGLLFNPGDPDDLAKKMVWALSHPEDMERMGMAARQRYEDLYTPQRNYEQLMAVYQEAIYDHRKVEEKR